MGIRELGQLARKVESEGYDATRYRVDLQAQTATPFACVVMAFLGIPFALSKGRGASLAAGIAISVGIGVTYFILQAALQAFGYSGVLPPVVAAWSANLLFTLLGAWLLLLARE
jgi:lipopolysaccharide export system permease protein